MSFSSTLEADNTWARAHFLNKVTTGGSTIVDIKRSEPDGHGGWLWDVWYTNPNGTPGSTFNVSTKHLEKWCPIKEGS